MGCRGCVNLQCSCFTNSSDTTMAVGNGSPYAPFTFRPSAVPFPRPFGHLYGTTPTQNLDGAAYTGFDAVTPDIDSGGNMRTGNGTSLTAPVDGIYLTGVMVPYLCVNTNNLNDNFSIRRNAVQVATVTYAHNSTTTNGLIVMMSNTTLLDLNAGDTLDLFVERVAGAGSVAVTSFYSGGVSYNPHLWSIWLGGEI